MRIRTGFVALVVLAAALPAAQAGEGFGGLYGGFTLGSNSQKANWYTTEVRYRDGTRVAPGTPSNTTTIPNGTALPAFLSDPAAQFKDGAYGVGVVLGYNWVFATNFVVGFELAAGSAPTYDRSSGSVPGLGSSSNDPVTVAGVQTSKPLVAGITAGYVVAPDTLGYVRVNYERIHAMATTSTTSCPASNLNYNPAAAPPGNAPIACNPAADVTEFSSSENLYGWGYGLGVERKFGETFAIRLEYRRAEYGKSKPMTVMTQSANNFGVDALLDMQKANIVELGVLFHF